MTEDLVAWLTELWDEEERLAKDQYLARLAADRKILWRYERACLRADDPTEDGGIRYEWSIIASTYEEVLCELATAHRHRPGFQGKWLQE